jgi:hypothetical protein
VGDRAHGAVRGRRRGPAVHRAPPAPGCLAALGAARQWALAALGVVAVSLLVQIVAIVPPTMDYQARIVELLPTAPRTKAPFDVKEFTSSMTMVSVALGLAFGAVGMSVWPVILYVWAGRLRAEAAARPIEQPAMQST